MSSVNVELLGRVTAWNGLWVADLTRQQQHLLAVLALAGGRPVPRSRLEDYLWSHGAPGGGLRRVASELRAQLRPASPRDDPVPGANDAYRLVIVAEQVDVHRFRAGVSEGRRIGEGEGTELIRRALGEWGANVSGLCGGEPLRGLPGTWADGVRHKLREEHRDAWVDCLRSDMERHRYTQALDACELLSEAPEALLDEPFVELWMLASHHTGHRERAIQIYRRANEAARSCHGAPAGGRLRRTAELIEADSTELGEGGDRPVLVPVRRTTTPTDDGSSMSEEKFTFNISDHAEVGAVVGSAHAPITIAMANDPGEKDELGGKDARDERVPEADG
ncbi:AfsR/SARP family transcriptional regulator [Actinomadura roseirufa]|uniref:AfsR/SARP family transcriptional regulator n=1 Tax=Actinomadura roseirufa TaxID=2094049 RepID=UPI00104166D4|nr:BTAD domain-containing putative transcriptional regulator [Actinomadura roseirufa]